MDTVAKVKSGQTMLIAGILKENKSDEMRGIPGLMHLPLLGPAFRRTEQNVQRTELVIFITPTLMTGKRVEDLTQQEQEHLQLLEKNFDVLKPKNSKSSENKH
jgi:general secretion pathway protein D